MLWLCYSFSMILNDTTTLFCIVDLKSYLIFLCTLLLLGPGEYGLRDTWGAGRGATKISDANPKSDVEWAIHRAKNLPGPGAVSLFVVLLWLLLWLWLWLWLLLLLLSLSPLISVH